MTFHGLDDSSKSFESFGGKTLGILHVKGSPSILSAFGSVLKLVRNLEVPVVTVVVYSAKAFILRSPL